MRKLSFFLFFSIVVITNQAQTNLDSLYTVWQDETQPDSNRVKAYNGYIWNGFLFSQPDSAFALAEALVDFGADNNYPKASSRAYNLQGISFHIQANYPKALDYYQRSIKVNEEIGDNTSLANALGNIGLIYMHQSNYLKALNYFQRSFVIKKLLNDQHGMANGLGNIGTLYKNQGENAKALDYFQQCLVIFKELGDQQGIANALNNIGSVYQNQRDDAKALDYYSQSLMLQKQQGDQRGIASSLGSIGNTYKLQGDNAKALDYFQQSKVIYAQLGDQNGIAISRNSIGGIYVDQGDHAKALDYCQKGYELALSIDALSQQRTGCQCLYNTYKAMGKGNKALEYLEKIQVIDDSLNAEETAKKLQQMEFTKQVLADSLKQEEVKLIVEIAHQKEVAKKDQTRNMLIAGAFFLLFSTIGFYMRWRYVKKSRDMISKERDRSENLLLNILPVEIAEELKENGEAAARDFDMVTILFTDFKGFTEASEKLSAANLVAEINTCFKSFDGIVDKYNIEKIKTIGDAYMAAGGLPVPDDSASKKTVLAAFEMQAFIVARKAERDAAGLPAFEMRIGLHTGPVVAGIVGVKKFQYDIWGDTVNTASRMESAGEVGKVNISQATYDLLKDERDFAFESRGKIEAKGKGEIEMFFVSKN